jgi:hypothetical protein
MYREDSVVIRLFLKKKEHGLKANIRCCKITGILLGGKEIHRANRVLKIIEYFINRFNLSISSGF